MEPFSLATFFVVKSLADTAIIGGASAAVTGFIGNATDRILCKQAKHFLDWQNKSLLPENHDVLKVLRFAMLKATTMLSNEVPVGPDTKKYKEELEEWITKQTGVINELEKWATWKPSVYSELDKFLLAHEKLNTPTEKLGSLITQEWIKHIEEKIEVATPLLFETYFNDGFINKQGNKLHWHNIVLTIFTDTIKNPDDKLGTRAYRALNIRFQTETKQELKLLQIELKQGFDNVIELISELQKGIPNYFEIKEAWELIKSQQKTILIQEEGNLILLKLLEGKEDTLRAVCFERDSYKIKLESGIKESEADKIKIEKLEEKIEKLSAEIKSLKEQNPKLRKKDIEATAALKQELLKQSNDPLKKAAAESLAIGDLENARALLTRAINEDDELLRITAAFQEAKKKEHAETFFQLAQLDNKEFKYYDALTKYRQAASLQPQNGLYLNGLGNFLITMAHYNEAIDNLNRALKHIPADSPQVEGTIYNNLGEAYRNKGEYDKAIDYYQKALAIDKKYHGEEHPKIATRYNNLGLTYDNKGEYDKAIDYYHKALVIDKKYHGEEHPKIATRYNNLGLAYHNKGEYDKAIDYYQKALFIGKKYHSEEHPNIAIRYSNLGLAYDNKGEYDKAIDYYQKALVIDKKFYGEEHLDIATFYNNLGSAYRNKGEYDKAIDYYQKALAIDKKYHGEEHPDIAIDYNNLGSAYHNKGEYNKAIDYYQKALAIDKKFNGEEHPNIAIGYNNLGLAYDNKGEYDKAIDYYQKALAIDKKFNGEEHPDIAIDYNNLGSAYHNKGEYDKAIDYFQKALEILSKFHPNGHPYIDNLKEKIAFLQSKK